MSADLLMRGRTYDPECSRTTNRLQAALGILREQGITPTYPDHSDDCMLHPANAYNRMHGYTYHCAPHCPRKDAGPSWPAWATTEIFDLAYKLADRVISARAASSR